MLQCLQNTLQSAVPVASTGANATLYKRMMSLERSARCHAQIKKVTAAFVIRDQVNQKDVAQMF